MSAAAIKIDQVLKQFGKNVVLEEVSLEIPRGQTLALLGRNGAGKTTLIRMLLGLLKPDAGSIQVDGCDPTREAIELRRRVGYLAEDQTMYGWMTAVELCHFLNPFYPAWNQSLADDYLERFDIPRHQRIERLSKGQNVKLGLTLALAHEPNVVILDDPALGLDTIARKEFNRDLIEHLQAAGRTVLFSSHLLDEVEAVADAVAILDGGRIIRQSATETLRSEVKRFVLNSVEIAGVMPPPGLLDVRVWESQFVVTVDGAERFVEQLNSLGIEHEIVELSLDEIFESFVIGRTQAWPQAGMPVVV
ncbi:ABC transporter ATP-binding protein [Gimesia maris]|uniref:ABC transporter ATP-binding protein YtrB n=1 Tax=Gimesia maris TaxID=122 RepID=A0ABX5YIY2_9PLAN|nr:ABC transporter ATP-binding protein [Gimesia maris]EDL59941.1 ABC transporter ATP binding protein [Gimesia maris DSM 8797]QDU13694.1 ABC transporter ATP-binding protein YtrB [Gimesia maris]QEG15661.1 ABC transporter ATP-binding protein YtrB [Gimesia maris]